MRGREEKGLSRLKKRLVNIDNSPKSGEERKKREGGTRIKPFHTLRKKKS